MKSLGILGETSGATLILKLNMTETYMWISNLWAITSYFAKILRQIRFLCISVSYMK